jgi:hypothetical protein
VTQAQLEQEVLSRLGDENRRDFVKDAVLEKAFVPPLVASFDLDDLKMDSVSALTPNGVSALTPNGVSALTPNGVSALTPNGS